MRLRDVKIGTQLWLGLGAILALVALLGAVAWVQADRLWQETQGLYDHPLAVSRTLKRLTVDVLTMHRDMKDLADAGSASATRTRSRNFLTSASEALGRRRRRALVR